MCYQIMGILLFLGSSSLVLRAEGPSILGFWQNVDDEEHFIGFENERFSLRTSEGEYRHFVVEGYANNLIKIPNLGSALPGGMAISYRLKGDELKTQRPSLLESDGLSKGGFQTFRRLVEKPSELTIVPLEVGASTSLSEERVDAISEELITRMERDQAARHGDYTREDHLAQIGDHRWLREHVRAVGWIDIERFGSRASQAAFLIAQHCTDMRLRLVAQEGLAKDMKKGLPCQVMFTILYDRNSLYTRGTQRYGTHFIQSGDRELTFLPFDDRTKIESWRESAKLSSFKEYLENFRQRGYKITVLESVRRGGSE